MSQFNLKLYNRYVDDTIVVLEGNTDTSKDSLQSFNSMHNKLKFTTESETQESINFLDLKLVKKAGQFIFDIHRKNHNYHL